MYLITHTVFVVKNLNCDILICHFVNKTVLEEILDSSHCLQKFSLNPKNLYCRNSDVILNLILYTSDAWIHNGKTRYRHRFFDQIGHETTHASNGNEYFFTKVLFTDRYTWQNFRLQFLRLVNRLYTIIHKTQKS